MINILGARARKLNEDHFEPLADEMVLHLPVPAPEYVWGACSEEEWLLARPHALSQTLYQLLQMNRMEDGSGVFEDCAGRLVVQLQGR
ncbi:hypothetical protein IFM58399_02801 [Aspergillus lentulus]|uniref:Uncharacterized protein n=1 Tax=Aspergillus lentulus TaxID=293939 RepID=A0AAN5YKF0_ASPLE|nr:uncharacterized protein IFM58399_02801 [Aspergillus lentulus]KAF4154396.1 hypothetical protein CNMCM6069_009414 [Aspergillus lentulus]KAF4202986.1 hypothetical protein CNMCM8927_009340 [Aspergillus lentulus]GFF31186.1 hypothetical protein IFM58399_02801 [Aspergillus lentulus]GFF82218.1 hypothetical protein IFM60648_06282 [Aspergillus lentulus]GFF85931.1 hypothetical protein IFM47457_06981 [Aspergillus lentulus]